ncbi:S8 family serine peptidase [Jatrophihabitans sp.]|uniref:S8 family serine peptidase n=1 Tax=Jatrophihabitans sp. TaxID=1932789 RepID=UPI0030C75862
MAALGLLAAGTVAVTPAGAASPAGTPASAASPAGTRSQQVPSAYRGTPTVGSQRKTGQTVLIVTASKAAQARLTSSVRHLHSMAAAGDSQAEASFRSSLPSIGAFSVQVPSAQADSAAAALRKQSGVSAVEVDTPAHFDSYTPSDPYWATKQASYLGVRGVDAAAAWSTQQGSPDVKIAILDSGVTIDHPDLVDKIAGSYDAEYGDDDVNDTLGHGTFVAGVAAASTDNGQGIAGAGFNSSILAVKVANDDDEIDIDDVVKGIAWATANGANVINMSFGSDVASPAEARAIAKAEAAGVIVVASAGNSGNIGDPKEYPASDPGVISVGATDGATKRASFSEYGTAITVGAPGVNIYSTTNPAGSAYFPAASYNSGDGTSFSSPIVAGEVALLEAQSPTASPSQIRAAIVNSAHGFAGQGMGTGQVDFALALQHLPPTTVPTVTSPEEGATGTGTITLSATSTAPKVQFYVSGAAVGAPVPVVDGVATTSWNSLGQANGSHAVTAHDCDAFTECNTDAAQAPALAHVIVANDAPVITAPAGAVQGILTPTATAPAGSGLTFYIDGKRVGFDATAPYSLLVGTSSLANGAHHVTAHECNSTGSACSGPVSALLDFTTNALLPTLSTPSPSAFSSTGHGSKTSVSTTLTIPGKVTEAAYLTVATASGTVVVDHQSLGSFAPGKHTVTWHGLGATKKPEPSGTYQLIVTTTGAGQQGSVITSVTVDNVSPSLTAVTGNGAYFYPYADGYKDTFVPSVKISESSTLTLVITTTTGKAVRTLSGPKPGAGTHALTWGGHYADGKEVPGTKYDWHFTAVDAAGNSAHSPTYTVSTSVRRLVAKTANVVHNADGVSKDSAGYPNYFAINNTPDRSCVFYDDHKDSGQIYKYGVDYWDQCSVDEAGFEVSGGLYTFTVPNATEYTSLSLSATGSSGGRSAVIYGGYDLIPTSGSAGGAQTYPQKGTSVTSASTKVYSLGTVSPAFHISTNHHVLTEFDMSNENGNEFNDFDLEYLTLKVNYKVLQ